MRAGSTRSSPCLSRCSTQSVDTRKTAFCFPRTPPSRLLACSHSPTSTTSSLSSTSCDAIALASTPLGARSRSRTSPKVWPYAVGRLDGDGRTREGMTRPLVESPSSSASWSECGPGWGGVTGTEEKRKEEPTEGKEETEGKEGQEQRHPSSSRGQRSPSEPHWR